AWLRLIPAPEAAWPVAALYRDTASGCRALEAVVGNGVPVAALEFLDAGTIAAAGASFPEPIREPGFMVLVDADGSEAEAARLRDEAAAILGDGAVAVHAPADRAGIDALWRWRDGVSLVVQAVRGGKLSEDIVVPLDRLAEAIEGTLAIGERHGLPACSWGHGGDGNLHSTFLLEPGDEDELRRARAAGEELFALAIGLGGSISGEHGTGWVKRGHLADQWPPAAVELHRRIKAAFDPKGLLNPGKKQ
ncbi:MAG TPA: FAD-linked oxidase C-terminal domain-containing protein, partial [Solirubrobacteraceae bacterium]